MYTSSYTFYTTLTVLCLTVLLSQSDIWVCFKSHVTRKYITFNPEDKSPRKFSQDTAHAPPLCRL